MSPLAHPRPTTTTGTAASRPRRRRRPAAIVAVTALVALLLALAPTQPAGAAAPSAGYNDWSCRPSAAHPEPVVLLHGLGSNGVQHWTYVAPQLVADGYCVYSLSYGQPFPFSPVGGLRSVDGSASQITAFIDRVRSSTGARQVSLVGHSEGGFLSIYVPKVSGGAERVRRVVALAPPTHGTTFGGLTTLGELLGLSPAVQAVLQTFGCQACADLAYGGVPVQRMVAGPIAQPGVSYTVIASRYDALVTPHETSFIREPGVDNRFVQDDCAIDTVGHIAMATDPTTLSLIRNALDPANPRPVTCTPNIPI